MLFLESVNELDPMLIDQRWRDIFPKLGLNQVYIGDGLPLCSDLADRHFLRKGATYVLLGSLDSPKFHDEPEEWVASKHITRLSLTETSSLYKKLCSAEANGGACQYKAKVVLDEDLACSDLECDVETLRIIEVGPGVYYEYLRLPCAYQAFYRDVKSLQTRYDGYACGDPRSELGGIGCCSPGENKFNTDFTLFSGERATYEGAQRRCRQQGLDLCKKPRYFCVNGCDLQIDYWGSAPCELKAKIGLDGTVALVHAVPPNIQADKRKIIDWLQEDTKSFFRVVWLAGSNIREKLADYEGMCESLGCPRDEFDNLCLCSVEVEESIAFSSAPTRDQVLQELAYGAFSPYNFRGISALDLGGGVKLHSTDGAFNVDSVFEVSDDNGITHFRKNLQSTVHIVSRGSGLSFRNPTHMIGLTDVEARDAVYETEAALDHYFVSGTCDYRQHCCHRWIPNSLLVLLSTTRTQLLSSQFALLSDSASRIPRLDTLTSLLSLSDLVNILMMKLVLFLALAPMVIWALLSRPLS